MAARNRYLLAYDIRDPRRLRRVHQTAKDFGQAIQYSLFLCDLTSVELARLRRRLRSEMHQGIDSAAIVNLGPAAGDALERVEFIGPAPPLPEDDLLVW